MAFLFDTCAISEVVAKKPNPHAVDAIMAIPQNEWFLASVTVGEIRRGIDEAKDPKRKEFLENWFQDHIRGIYLHKVIVFDVEEATEWGALVAKLRRQRLPMSVVDSLIAATALTHGLTVVTRNERHFANAGVPIFNPWK